MKGVVGEQIMLCMAVARVMECGPNQSFRFSVIFLVLLQNHHWTLIMFVYVKQKIYRVLIHQDFT